MLSRKIITLLIYILIITLLFSIQPSLFFDNDGNIKCFGYNTDDSQNTISPLIVFIPFIIIISYLVILIIEIIYT
jgi:hypothetical protein